MAFTSGTATDYQDLLLKLKDYLALQGWTILEWTAGGSLASESMLKARGPGAGADKQVFVNIRTVWDTVVGIYSWESRMACGYSAAAAWGSQLSETPNSTYFNLWNNAIPYWFFVNDRRLIVVAKTSTNYVSFHAGFFLPWGTPSQYPFPIYHAGDYYKPAPYSTNSAARRHCFEPGNVSDANPGGWCRSPTGIWYPIINHAETPDTNERRGIARGERGFLWPFSNGTQGWDNEVGVNDPISWCGDTTSVKSWAGEDMVATQQGERCLMPIMVCSGNSAPFGVIDGAYAVGGTGLFTEQQLTLGARTFRVFQNVQRNSPDDFYCIEEI